MTPVLYILIWNQSEWQPSATAVIHYFAQIILPVLSSDSIHSSIFPYFSHRMVRKVFGNQ